MANSKAPPPPAAKPGAPAMKAPIVVKAGTAPAIRTAAAAAPVSDGMKAETMVIVFVDLARFQIASRRVKDDALVPLLEEFYERVLDGVKPAGGRVVKYMGDGVLVVFPVERASQAARALLMLKGDVDARLAKKKFLCSLVVRVHTGDVMAGGLGPKADKRYDVIGQNVNKAAAMRSGAELSLSSETYAKLDAKTQKLFKAKGDCFVPA